MRVPAAVPTEVAQADASHQAIAIEADGLSFSYGERRALNDLSFSISRGEIFGFLGPNGGGKTTLFRLLSTLVPIQMGRARVLRCDLRGATLELRRRIGVVFQHPSIDGKLTVLENLKTHGRLYGLPRGKLVERASAMLARVGLSDRAHDRAETLSGGLRRRVELAKALLHEPELLLLDEPSTGLDPVARREFMGYLAELRQREGLTVVLTTHHLEEAERCDRIALLSQGQVVAIGSPSELKASVGGDVVVIRAGAAELLQRKLAQQLKLRATLVDGALRIERPRGHELVRDIFETFEEEVESVTFGKPTLEDVFVHLTGRRFFGSESTQAQQ